MKIICVACLFFCNILHHPALAQNADIRILDNINSNDSPFADHAFLFLTNTAAPVSFGMPIVLLAVGYMQKNKTLQNYGWQSAESVLLSSAISLGLKYAINRPRPYDTYNFIENKTDETSPSFPSMHTSIAFSTATSLSLAFPKWYIIVPAYAWACSVGYSRMYLGVHYPTDILGGIVTGMGSAYLVYKLNTWLNKKNTPAY